MYIYYAYVLDPGEDSGYLQWVVRADTAEQARVRIILKYNGACSFLVTEIRVTQVLNGYDVEEI